MTPSEESDGLQRGGEGCKAGYAAAAERVNPSINLMAWARALRPQDYAGVVTELESDVPAGPRRSGGAPRTLADR